MPTITNRALRGSTIVAIAAIGVLGLAGCSGGGGDGADEAPTTSGSSEESAPATSEASEPSAAEGQCTAEQVSSLTGTEFPEAALASATAAFEPASLLGDLPTTCVITFAAGELSASYAVLPGGTATIDALVANSGGQAQDAGGTLVGTVDGATVAGGAYSAIAQGGEAGFEDTADLIVVAASPSLGG